MCWPDCRQRAANAGSVVLNTWKHIPNVAAIRPARLGLMREPAGPARKTGRLRM